MAEQDPRCSGIQRLGCGKLTLPHLPSSRARGLICQNLTRIATLLCLRHISSGELVHVINTHYDDMGKKSRAESSYIIRQLSYEYIQAMEQETGSLGASPVILLGDFSRFCDCSTVSRLNRPLIVLSTRLTRDRFPFKRSRLW